jgi:hypothetical protein
MIRTDPGTANLAVALDSLLTSVRGALLRAGLDVRGAAVADLYQPRFYWAGRYGKNLPSPPSLPNALAAAAAQPEITPTSCTSDTLLDEVSTLPAWSAGGIQPFMPMPSALLVLFVDTGARPADLRACPRADALWNSDPAAWVQAAFLRRAQTRFLFAATPEGGDLAAMRTHCLSVPGFPATGLDVLAPSPNPFFDPLTDRMNAVEDLLATRVDLCDALGNGAVTGWNDLGKRWYTALAALP